MEPNNLTQPTQQVTPEIQIPVTPIQTPPASSNKTRYILVAALVLLILLVIGGGTYYLGVVKQQPAPSQKNNNVTTATIIPSPTSTTTATPQKQIEIQPKNLVLINQNTVSYGYFKNNVILRYRNKVYSYDITSKKMKEPETESLYSNVNWYGLIQAPQSVSDAIKKYSNADDEIFDFRSLSDNKSFLFIMRWGKITGDNGMGWDLPIYYFNANKQKLELLASYTWPNSKENPVPFINSVSLTEKYIAFNMFGCWNCGAGYPEIMLMNLDTKETKRIGKVLEFTWKENGNYTYKDYKEIPCPDEPGGPGPCIESVQNLPLISNSFQ